LIVHSALQCGGVAEATTTRESVWKQDLPTVQVRKVTRPGEMACRSCLGKLGSKAALVREPDTKNRTRDLPEFNGVPRITKRRSGSTSMAPTRPERYMDSNANRLQRHQSCCFIYVIVIVLIIIVYCLHMTLATLKTAP